MHRNSVISLASEVFTHVSNLCNVVKQNSLTQTGKITLEASVAAAERNVKSRMISHSFPVMLFWKKTLANIFISLSPAPFESYAASVLTTEKHTPLLSSSSLVYLQPVVLSWGLRGISSKYPLSHEMFQHRPSTILDIFSSLPERRLLWTCFFPRVKRQLGPLMVPSDPLLLWFLKTNSLPQFITGLMMP